MKKKLALKNGKSAEKLYKTRQRYNPVLMAEVSMAKGLNKIESLKIFDNDDINSKVDSFSKKHKLKKEQKDLILAEINKQINNKKKKERAISQSPIRPKAEIEHIHPNNNLNVITKKFLRIKKPKSKPLKGKNRNNDSEENRLKLIKYNYMFQQLDSDNDGKISTQKINLCVLDYDILEAMTPILKELQKEQKTMEFKDFCARADKCFEIKFFEEA